MGQKWPMKFQELELHFQFWTSSPSVSMRRTEIGELWNSWSTHGRKHCFLRKFRNYCHGHLQLRQDATSSMALATGAELEPDVLPPHGPMPSAPSAPSGPSRRPTRPAGPKKSSMPPGPWSTRESEARRRKFRVKAEDEILMCFEVFEVFRWQNRYPCIAVIVTWLSFWPLPSSTRLLLQSVHQRFCAPNMTLKEVVFFVRAWLGWLAGTAPRKHQSQRKNDWKNDIEWLCDFLSFHGFRLQASRLQRILDGVASPSFRRSRHGTSSRGDRPEARTGPSKDYVRRNSIRTGWRGWTMLNRAEPWWTWWNWVIFQSSLCSVIEVMRQGTQTISGWSCGSSENSAFEAFEAPLQFILPGLADEIL